MWRLAVSRRRLRSITTAIPKLQAAVRAWRARANMEALRIQAVREKDRSRLRVLRRRRIERQQRELELLRSLKTNSVHVRSRYFYE